MKNLEELGVSPAPWDGVTFCHPHMNGYVVCNANAPDGDGKRKIVASDVRVNNCLLIGAAPELYEALRDLYEYFVFAYGACTDRDKELLEKARAALSKAGGDEV